MADNSFRTFRRDSLARDAEPEQYGLADPLAELARLIGQSEAHGDHAPDAAHSAESFDDRAPAPTLDWAAADEEYAPHGRDADEDYGQPAPAETYYQHPSGEASWARDRGFQEEAADARQYAHPPAAFDDGRSDPRRNGGLQDAHYRDDPRPAASRAEPSAYIPPQGGYQADEHGPYHVQDPSYGGDAADYGRDHYEEESAPSRRSGTVVIVAVLGLAVLGTAGALGYRAMFGGPMIPSLPPIIKPGDTPIKITPKRDAQTGAPSQTAAGTPGTGEQVVTHEEQPVDIQTANPVPRVVTTIPVISNTPDQPLPGTQPPAAQQSAIGAPGAPAVPPVAYAEPNTTPPPSGVPDRLAAPSPAQGTGSRPVQTIKIHSGLPTAAEPAEAAPASEGRPVKPRPPATRPLREAAPRTAPGGPLSIVPTQENRAPTPAPVRTTMARPTAPISLSSQPAEAVPSAGGGYAVQVTSQRSEAEAQAAFRSLQARYPQQLGGHRASIRRADLGAKGVYYRALVGPFASAEQAASLCNNLKAAGGSCLIQRN
jgi:hypothetical protein